ncbi:MAG TPA: DUF262 domain-containing protein [Dehalococcoidia bacterium]
METDREVAASELDDQLFSSAPDDPQVPDPYPRQAGEELAVFATPIDPDVQTLLDQMDDRSLIVNPDFQRQSVWMGPRQSRLIESLIVNIPIPPCYFAEDANGIRVVVDGQQRLRAIEQFRAGQYALSGLEIRDDLNGKRWTDLAPRDARRIVRRVLRTIVISHLSDPDIKFEIFRRLNTGGVPLTEQEIRNAVYRGKFNSLLDRLARNEMFLGLLRRTYPDLRLRHHELVLRFFALDHQLGNYQPPLKKILNSYMDSARDFDVEVLELLQQRFLAAMSAVGTVFGGDAYRRFRVEEEGEALREAEELTSGELAASYETVVSKAVYDLEMIGLVDIPPGELEVKRQAIRTAFEGLSTESETFVDVLSRATDHRSRFYTRMRLWGERLANEGIDAPFFHRLPSDS